jgi:hypothetical protein
MKARIVSMSALQLLLVLLAYSGPARSDEPASSAPPGSSSDQRLQRLMARFHRADLNGDGQLTRDEAQKGMPRVYRHFSEIDSQHRGYVTLDQIASYLEAHPQSNKALN